MAPDYTKQLDEMDWINIKDRSTGLVRTTCTCERTRRRLSNIRNISRELILITIPLANQQILIQY